MKIIYLAQHQIHNLTPLYRELAKKKEISLKVLYWQNLSDNTFCKEFGKMINFGTNHNNGYDYSFIDNQIKKVANFSLFYKFKISIKLINFLLKEEFDLIIIHGYRLPHFIASLVSKFKKKKTVMRSISYDLGHRTFLIKTIRYFYYAINNLFIDEFWYIHELNKKFFTNNTVKEKQLKFIDHCQGEYDHLIKDKNYDIDKIDTFCNKYSLPLNKKFILFVGRFVERKNPKILIEAFIDAKISDEWCLIMVGNGKFEKDIKDLVKKNNIKNIKLFNFKNQFELINFFLYSEILVLPSNLGDTHGNIAAEAIQFGCALILSNMVGLSPECKKNDIGLVFDIKKKDDLIKQLELITTDNQLLKKFQINALEYGKMKKPSHVANLIEKNLFKYEI